MSYPVVHVKWIDASYEGDILKPEEMTPTITLESVGFLVRDDKDSISIVMEISNDGTCRHIVHIPKVCIIHQDVIEYQDTKETR